MKLITGSYQCGGELEISLICFEGGLLQTPRTTFLRCCPMKGPKEKIVWLEGLMSAGDQTRSGMISEHQWARPF